MPTYTITEPHPTVAQNTYIHAGRGGAGNHFRAPLTTSPAGVPSAIHPVASAGSTASNSSSSSSAAAAGPRRFYSGRGGAGNAHSHVERPVISFEDEFSRADTRERNELLGSGYHVGRGGAGNFRAGSAAPSSKKARSGSSSSTSSGDSSASGGSVLRRLSSALSRR